MTEPHQQQMSRTEIAMDSVAWLQNHLRVHCRVDIKLSTSDEIDCWGMAWEQEKPNSYCITIAVDQSLRDFLATCVHEMIHVKQWATGDYWGDGEREANRKQYRLADRIWRSNIL